MYLKRKIDQYLENWKKDTNRLPLIVKGPRQIGKTESILHFCKQNYQSIIYINFALETQYKHILDDGYSVENIIKNLTLINPQFKIISNDTVFIFDELQEYPDLATSLKSFKLDGRYDVICSGSLLGIHYNRIHSNSVGYKRDYEMYSMDFEEYLWALGYQNDRIEDILNHMVTMEPFSELEMNVYKKLFLDYCVLGGMPAVLKDYVENKHFSGSLEKQQQIRLDYEEDVRKYALGLDQTKIIRVYRNIPAQLAKENKKFQFSKLGNHARSRDYDGCIEWLIDAGVIMQCLCLNYPELPLKGNTDDMKYKLYYPDTGLLVSALDEEAQMDLRMNKNLGVYKGGLYENFVAEAFMKQNLGLYYYKKEDSTLEEDFFVRSTDELIPVEVKSNRKQSKALRMLIDSDRYSDIHYGIKLGDFNIGNENQIITFPYFCSFLIKRFIHVYFDHQTSN